VGYTPVTESTFWGSVAGWTLSWEAATGGGGRCRRLGSCRSDSRVGKHGHSGQKNEVVVVGQKR
jgi:hypothetical protein